MRAEEALMFYFSILLKCFEELDRYSQCQVSKSESHFWRNALNVVKMHSHDFSNSILSCSLLRWVIQRLKHSQCRENLISRSLWDQKLSDWSTYPNEVSKSSMICIGHSIQIRDLSGFQCTCQDIPIISTFNPLNPDKRLTHLLLLSS